MDIEKVLTEVRGAADNILLYGQMMKTHDLAVTEDFVISDVSVVDDLRTALASFPAEMPGAIGVHVGLARHSMACDNPWRNREKPCSCGLTVARTALADLEETP